MGGKERFQGESLISRNEVTPRLLALMLHQDDPRKCTSARLCRLGLVKSIWLNRIPRNALVLDPSSDTIMAPQDSQHLRYGLLVVDCSWKRAGETFSTRIRGMRRRLPVLLASNPVNYGLRSILSSAEALAAALCIFGKRELSERILYAFKWGPTFLTLNHDPLVDYSRCASREEVCLREKEYFP